MIKLLALLPLLALASCSYPSKYEAETACYEWVKKGGSYIYVRKNSLARDFVAGKITPEEFLNSPDFVEQKMRTRYCQYEEVTRQYIGWGNGTKAGKKYSSDEMPDRKIIKRFRY